MAVKTVTTTIPTNLPSIDEWIKENHEKLLRIHLSPEQMAFEYEITSQDASSRSLEISFVRKSEIDDWRKLSNAAGVELIALGAGTRDAVTAFIASGTISGPRKFVHFDDHIRSVTALSNGRRMGQTQVSLEEAGKFMAEESLPEDSPAKTILSGHLPKGLKGSEHETFLPLNLPTEYSLAVGLAIKGLLSEISPANFLSSSERERYSNKLQKSLTQRLVLALGAVLVLALGLEMLSATILQSRIEAIDEQLASSGTDLAAVQVLDRKVKNLEHNLAGSVSMLRRSNYAKILHDVAKSTPDSLWLNRLTVKEDDSHNQEVLIYGFARTDEAISQYLKKLEIIARPIELELIHSGTGKGDERIYHVKRSAPAMVSFAIKAVFARS